MVSPPLHHCATLVEIFSEQPTSACALFVSASLLSRPTFASPARPWIDVGCVPVSEKGARNAHHYGAPRSMKMGTIPSPWRYDAMTLDALRSPNLRLPSISHFASPRCASSGWFSVKANPYYVACRWALLASSGRGGQRASQAARPPARSAAAGIRKSRASGQAGGALRGRSG